MQQYSKSMFDKPFATGRHFQRVAVLPKVHNITYLIAYPDANLSNLQAKKAIYKTWEENKAAILPPNSRL